MKVKTEPLCGPMLITTYLHGYVKSAGCPLGPKEETMKVNVLEIWAQDAYAVWQLRQNIPWRPEGEFTVTCAKLHRTPVPMSTLRVQGFADWPCDSCAERFRAYTVEDRGGEAGLLHQPQTEPASIRGQSGHPACEVARLEQEVERQRKLIERANERAENSIRRAGQQSAMLDVLRREKADLEETLAEKERFIEQAAAVNATLRAEIEAMRKAIDDHLATRQREREATRRRKFRLKPVLRRTGVGGRDLPVYEFEAEYGRPFYIAIRRALPRESTDYYRWDEPKGVQGATLVLPAGVELECYELVADEPLDLARR